MIRNYYLSSSHYASQWKVRDSADRHDIEVINQKAYDFATTKDPVLREKLQLEVLEAFHGYLIKYFNLIVFAEVPETQGPQAKDVTAFLKMLLPANTEKDPISQRIAMRTAARHLHLAFKDAVTSEEVYDTLVTIFLDVASKYNPHYTVKTKEVCDYFETVSATQIVKLDELGASMGVNPVRYVRNLVRHKYLQSVAGPRKKIQGYQRGPAWPAPASFFESGPVGFTYYVQRWFRYYLQTYIELQMAQLESGEHVLSLDAIKSSNSEDEDGVVCGLPHAEGNWTDTNGSRWAADLSMLELWRTLDISEINDEWVKGTTDYLFRDLEVRQRYLLQLVFVKELTWTEIATVLDCNFETVRNHFKELMTYLEHRSKY